MSAIAATAQTPAPADSTQTAAPAPAATPDTNTTPTPAPAAPAPADSGVRNPDAPISPAATTPTPQDRRIFGVLPNYRTVDSTVAFHPLTTKQKFTIAVKDSFDWPGYFLAAAYAGLYQAEDQNPSFGQGVVGYLKRYGTSYLDNVDGNMMTEAIFPTLLHEDPRYFRKINGTPMHRTLYAISRIFVTTTDSGGHQFNFAEIGGNGVAAAVGNLYYPGKNFPNTINRWGTSVGTDMVSDILKEFWPDIKKRFFTKRANVANP